MSSSAAAIVVDAAVDVFIVLIWSSFGLCDGQFRWNCGGNAFSLANEFSRNYGFKTPATPSPPLYGLLRA